MNDLIAPALATMGGLALLTALFWFWQSLRAALGVIWVGSATETDTVRDDLLERKEAILQGIRDLEFEHEAGKIDDTDFDRLQASMREEAKQILAALHRDLDPYREQADRWIDAYLGGDSDLPAAGEGSASKPKGRKPRSAKTDPGRKRAQAGVQSESGSMPGALLCPQCMAPNAPDSKICSECRARVAPLPCKPCGAINDADATFCKKCGAPLQDELGSDL